MTEHKKSKRPTLSQVDQFYWKQIEPELVGLHNERKTIFSILVGVVAVAALLIVFLNAKGYSFNSMQFVFYAAIFVAVAAVYLPMKEFKKSFKYRVMKKIVAEFFPELTYTPEYTFPLSLYEESGLFRTHVKYQGNDLFQGKLGDVDFQFSDVHASYTTGSGKNQRTVVEFHGLFFCGDFHRDIRAYTMIKPDYAEASLGILGRGLQRVASGDRLVDLENPEFEKLFVVTGDNQVEARYILTPAFMEDLVKFRKKIGHDIHVSFMNGKMFLAINSHKDSFEPKIFGSIAEHGDILSFIDSLLLMYSLAEDFCRGPRPEPQPVHLAQPTQKFAEMRDFFKKNFGDN